MNTVTNETRRTIQARADYLAYVFDVDAIITDLMQNFGISKDRATRHASKAIRKQNK